MLAGLIDQLHGLAFEDEGMGHPTIRLRCRDLYATGTYLVRTITAVQATAASEAPSVGVVTYVHRVREVDDVSTFGPGEELAI
jgi:hypothetical protein